jgi:hypothetical protein
MSNIKACPNNDANSAYTDALCKLWRTNKLNEARAPDHVRRYIKTEYYQG